MRTLPFIAFPQGFRKSKKFGCWTWEVGAKISSNGVINTDTKKILLSEGKFAKKLTFFARQFYTIYQQNSSNLRPLLLYFFLQRFRISKIFGHPTSGIGGKKTFKRYLKSENLTVLVTVFVGYLSGFPVLYQLHEDATTAQLNSV